MKIDNILFIKILFKYIKYSNVHQKTKRIIILLIIFQIVKNNFISKYKYWHTVCFY